MSVKRYLANILTLAEFELRKVRHDTSQIWIRSVQPALWLLVFGTVMSRIRTVPPGFSSYLQYLTPGILAQSVLFGAIFYGISVVWERDLGLLNKLLSTPVPRSAIVLGKALSAGVRGIFQAVTVVALALIIGVEIIFDPLNILCSIIVILLLGMCFSGMSMMLAPIFRTRERMMGIGQAITMPLFFASNAIYPISLMPAWLKSISAVNPLSYVVDALRSLLVTGDVSGLPRDLVAIATATAFMLGLAGISFRRIIT